MPELIRLSCWYPRPNRSMTPGLMFSTTTSLIAVKRCTSVTALGSLRFSWTLNLLTLMLLKAGELSGLSQAYGVRRAASSWAQLSTLMTWAPRNPHSKEGKGPAKRLVKSSILTP